MLKLFTIALPATSGKKLIHSSKLFSYINSDFANWGLDRTENKTSKMNVDVLEMDKDATFKELFLNPDKMWMTQEQILYFVKNHKNKLRQEGWANFFLLKKDDVFFVARVDVHSGGSLKVLVYQFVHADVWYAEYRHRLVVPQLADTLTLSPFDPSDFKITYQGVKYKLVKE